MKKLVLKLFLFCLPVILVFAYIEVRLKQMPNSYSTKKQIIEKHKEQVEIIVVGGSHALYGINPKHLSKSAINIANASQSLYFDCKILESILPKCKKVNCIIFNLSNPSFYYNMNDGKEKIRTYAYKHYFNINNTNFKWYDAKNYSQIAFWGPQKTFELAKNNFNTKFVETGDNAAINNLGSLDYDSINSSERISTSLGREKFNYHLNLIKKDNLKINLKEMYKILDTLKRKNITTYFVYTPTYRTYYENNVSNKIAANDSIKSIIIKKYNAKILDFSTNINFTYSDFYDNDHLNKYGSEKFTKMLDSIVLKN